MTRFIDEVNIVVQSGRGGAGAVSFRREKYVPKGGPDGGDGGRGGDVLIEARRELKTLFHLQTANTIRAGHGSSGRGRNQNGADGDAVVVPVPLGTVVYDAETKRVLADLTKDGDSYPVVRGGRGGRGNAQFASSTNRAPRYAQGGEAGEEIMLNLQIKLIADVGIVGLPNAGKSTLLSVMTNAKPKIAGYPFTTLSPNLGVMRYRDEKEIILADVPGLIEGASKGLGLGIRFLKHIERTGILLFLVDLSEGNYENHYATLVNELRSYSEALLKKPRLVVGSKLDTVEDEVARHFLSMPFDGKKVAVSSATRTGIDTLKDAIIRIVEKLDGN